MEFWKGCVLRPVYCNGEIVLSVYYSQILLEDDLEVDVSKPSPISLYCCQLILSIFWITIPFTLWKCTQSPHSIYSLFILFYSIQIDFLITKIRIKNINEGMVRTPKLGKRVKKETVSEEDQERDWCRRDGIYSRRDREDRNYRRRRGPWWRSVNEP